MPRSSAGTPSFLVIKQIPKVKFWASLAAQMVKNLPAMWETWVQSLGWDDHREKGMTTHSCILAWRIPWTEEPGGFQSMGEAMIQLQAILSGLYFLSMTLYLDYAYMEKLET